MRARRLVLALSGSRLYGRQHARPLVAGLRKVFCENRGSFGQYAGEKTRCDQSRADPHDSSSGQLSWCRRNCVISCARTDLMDQTSCALGTEWSLLRAACSESAPRQDLVLLLQKPIHWISLLDLAGYHGVQPLLYQRLSSMAELIPAGELRALEQDYQTNLHKAMLLSLDLIRIYDLLSSRGVKVLADRKSTRLN